MLVYFISYKHKILNRAHEMEVYNMPNKEGAINPIQKGARRQNLHDKQDNLGGNHKTKPEYTNFEGKPID
jgi:hypothetical protein